MVTANVREMVLLLETWSHYTPPTLTPTNTFFFSSLNSFFFF